MFLDMGSLRKATVATDWVGGLYVRWYGESKALVQNTLHHEDTKGTKNNNIQKTIHGDHQIMVSILKSEHIHAFYFVYFVPSW
jgi:hypothetical protein